MPSARTMSSQRKKAATPPDARRGSRIGIALAGGGPLGAVYEIGALAAIEESIAGLDLNQADIYVGISAGGIIAAGLANGITPHQICRLFVESEDYDRPASRRRLGIVATDLDAGASVEFGQPGFDHAPDSSLTLVKPAARRAAGRSLGRLQDTLQDLERYLKVAER